MSLVREDTLVWQDNSWTILGSEIEVACELPGIRYHSPVRVEVYTTRREARAASRRVVRLSPFGLLAGFADVNGRARRVYSAITRLLLDVPECDRLWVALIPVHWVEQEVG